MTKSNKMYVLKQCFEYNELGEFVSIELFCLKIIH